MADFLEGLSDLFHRDPRVVAEIEKTKRERIRSGDTVGGIVNNVVDEAGSSFSTLVKEAGKTTRSTVGNTLDTVEHVVDSPNAPLIASAITAGATGGAGGLLGGMGGLVPTSTPAPAPAPAPAPTPKKKSKDYTALYVAIMALAIGGVAVTRDGRKNA